MHTVEIFPQQAELGKIPLYAPSEASLPPRDQPEETGKRQPTESNKTSLSGFAGILNNIKPPSALPANLQLNSVIPKKTVQFNQSGKDALPPTPADILETDRRASKRVSQVIDPYLKQLERVSDAYTGVMLAPSVSFLYNFQVNRLTKGNSREPQRILILKKSNS